MYTREETEEMKIVFLEAGTLGADMDFSPFEKLGEVVRYETSTRGYCQ